MILLASTPLILGGAVLLGVLIRMVSLALFLRGRLKIVIPTKKFSYGDTIEGEVLFTTYRSFKGKRLSVALVCEETVRHIYRSQSGSDERRVVVNETYREELDLLGPTDMGRGEENTYSFKLKVPDEQPIGGGNDGQIGLGIPAGMMLADTSERKTEWFLRTKFEVEGRDLKSKQAIKLMEG